MVLDTSLLHTQQYKVRIKGKVEQPREMGSAFPYTSVLYLLKREPRLEGDNFTYLLLSISVRRLHPVIPQSWYINTSLCWSANSDATICNISLENVLFFSPSVPLMFVRLTLMVCEIGDKLLYICWFARCCTEVCSMSTWNSWVVLIMLFLHVLYIDLRPDQTCQSKDGGSFIFRCPVMGRDCVGELGWQYVTGLKSHGTVTNWCTERGWPVNWMTVISARWSNMPFQRRRKLHIPLAIYGKRLSGHKTII